VDPRDIRRERRRDQARKEILDATRAVVLRVGAAGLTLSAIAKEVQLTKAALYYYFPSKEALVFEMIYLGLEGHAKTVESALLTTASGAEAIEALIRTATAHYAAHIDDMRLAYMVPQLGTAGATRLSPEMVERIRPFNDRIYGTAAEKIRQDQEAGLIAPTIDGRRIAFLAHMAVIGMLTIEGVVDAADDEPLIHPRDALVDDLVRSFTARLALPE